jgi:hypothetical protein
MYNKAIPEEKGRKGYERNGLLDHFYEKKGGRRNFDRSSADTDV